MPMKIIFTGQFFKLNDYLKKWDTPVTRASGVRLIPFSIANSIPNDMDCRHLIAGTVEELVPNFKLVQEYHAACHRSVADRRAVLHRYEKIYKHHLLKLDCQSVFDKLTEDGIPILLCWERSDHPCHRHWVRQWFRFFKLACGEFGEPYNYFPEY